MEWSSLKKAVEARVANSLEGRVKFLVARYRSQDDKPARAWIQIDGEEVFEFCVTHENIPPETSGLRERISIAEFYDTLRDSLSMTVESMLESDLLLLRALALLDPRMGKRRLKELHPEALHPLLRGILEKRVKKAV